MTVPATALLAATAVHAGFQLAVTTVVYPALARVPAADWPRAHRAHTRSITPLVAVVYGGAAAASGWALRSRPDAATVAAASATAAAVLVTAVAAAPAHRRLAAGHDPGRVARLRRADRVRAAAAVAALVAAVRAAR